MRGENLDGHGAVQPRIACAIDFAHPARAKWSDDFIRPEVGPGRESHGAGIIALVALFRERRGSYLYVGRYAVNDHAREIFISSVR